MRQEYLPARGDIVIISDSHFKQREEKNLKILLNFLSSLNVSNTKHVVFAGDVFDFIAFFNSFFINYWSAFFSCCQKLKNRGIEVVFIEGNHDFGLEHFFSNALKSSFTLGGDMMLSFSHPTLGVVQIGHGDNIVCPSNYLPFRRLVKSKITQTISKYLVPGRLMFFIFGGWAKISRKKDQYRFISREKIISHVKDFLHSQNKKTDVLVLGHVHVLTDCHVEKTRLLIGPSWFEIPSVLIIKKDGSIERQNLS